MRRDRESARANDELASEDAICPVCDDTDYVARDGCSRCGYGRRSALGRNGGRLAGIVAFVVGALGLTGVCIVGAPPSLGPWFNAMFVVMAMVFCGFGTYLLLHPTRFGVSPVTGTDAWGRTEYGATRPATAEEGRTNGAVLVAVGLIFLAIGVFLGAVVP